MTINNFNLNDDDKNKNAKVDNLLNSVSKYLGKNPQELKDAMKNGNISQSLNNLNSEDAAKIKKVLNNKNLVSKLLSSPQAQKLLKDIMGDK